ncbi:MAG: Com family DNA-binding transcriptional regulator [Rhodocyclaceae bacterium]|nr:Com family DNA-binding transcriptional regulator [Rhodocyclaceae bacterium]
MDEIRCGNCRRLLARGECVRIEIKCPRCGVLGQFFFNSKAASLGQERHGASSQTEVTRGNDTEHSR